MRSFEFSLHHRNHEWWVTTRDPVVLNRMRILQELRHRFLDGFSFDFPSGGFSIRPHAPEWVFNRVRDYLKSRPGKEEKEYLRVLSGYEVFPAEVIRDIWWQFRPNPTRGNATWDPDAPWQPDPHRISAFSKFEYSRAKAWDLTCQYGRSVGIEDSGWRKCHTENHWAWFVPDASPSTQEAS